MTAHPTTAKATSAESTAEAAADGVSQVEEQLAALADQHEA